MQKESKIEKSPYSNIVIQANIINWCDNYWVKFFKEENIHTVSNCHYLDYLFIIKGNIYLYITLKLW